MYDIHVRLDDTPGALAKFGEAMGESGVSLEGGGVFTFEKHGHAHFLVHDGERARGAAERAGLEVVAVREVVVRRLKQDVPGQLGAIAAALAAAGVNIITQYSDHSNQLVLVVDDAAKAAAVTEEWAP
jgi:hypothetical protein